MCLNICVGVYLCGHMYVGMILKSAFDRCYFHLVTRQASTNYLCTLIDYIPVYCIRESIFVGGNICFKNLMSFLYHFNK